MSHIASYRDYKGWDVFYAATSNLAWTARREYADGGHKLRADTWEGIKRLIDDYG
jgi:hypothetical protein